jgi:hypothetical protein
MIIVAGDRIDAMVAAPVTAIRRERVAKIVVDGSGLDPEIVGKRLPTYAERGCTP